mgnify:CR=1 FL=1
MTTEEYRNYKILFEKCLTLKEEDPDLYFGSSYEADIDSLENENPKKEPENEV